jgi:putative transposase
MVAELQRRCYAVNKKRVQRLMRLMGVEALYPKPKTTIAAPEHRKYPYLLRGLDIVRPNQVWEMDITYIPMRHGFMYLAAIIDVFSRRILGWGLSNTMEAEWCAEIAEDAFQSYGRPEIFNTDQGSQFTSDVFIKTLVGEDAENPKLKISMDGRGRATDDIYIERFWRSIKYEDIYLNAYEDGQTLWRGIDSYISSYNSERLHQSLGYQTPESVYKKAS